MAVFALLVQVSYNVLLFTGLSNKGVEQKRTINILSTFQNTFIVLPISYVFLEKLHLN